MSNKWAIKWAMGNYFLVATMGNPHNYPKCNIKAMLNQSLQDSPNNSQTFTFPIAQNDVVANGKSETNKRLMINNLQPKTMGNLWAIHTFWAIAHLHCVSPNMFTTTFSWAGIALPKFHFPFQVAMGNEKSLNK